VAAWIDPGQLLTAFVVTGITGGILAIAYSATGANLGSSLDRTGNLLADIVNFRLRREAPGAPAAASIPYAPAIAVGTLFSFFAQ
jgi:Flp pilus assembly protein protease CpaA